MLAAGAVVDMRLLLVVLEVQEVEALVVPMLLMDPMEPQILVVVEVEWDPITAI